MNLPRRTFFKNPRTADAAGWVAQTPEITTSLLLQAYRHGVFPWSDRPARWYSPDPRAIFDLDRIRFSQRLRRQLRQPGWTVTFDQAFETVVRCCHRHHRATSWLSPSMVDAFHRFHLLGYAHSVEVWREGKLAGGLYGVHIGAFFAGESMFHHQANASKIAFAHLVVKLRELGVVLFDSQVLTPHTANLGAFEIPRSEYLDRLEAALALGLPQRGWAEPPAAVGEQAP
jgi:leucyl/phenylalanyl-tRNA--protein transferase